MTSNWKLILDPIKIGGIEMNEDLAYSKYGKGKTQWKGSSMGFDGIKRDLVTHNKENPLEEELLENLALFNETFLLPIKDSACHFFEKFLEEVNIGVKDRSDFSHASKVIKLYKEATENVNNKKIEECFFEDIINEKVIAVLCSEIVKWKSSRKLKTYAKKFITYCYGADENILKLNPTYMKLINMIRYWDWDSPEFIPLKYIKPEKDHKYLIEFIKYLNEKKRKTQKEDRKKINSFLLWITQNIEEFKGIEAKEVNVSKIKETHLKQYLAYHEKRVRLKEISPQSFGPLIQPIKRWFKFLKQKQYISFNPALKLKIKWFTSKRNPPLISLEKMEQFLDVIYEASDDPLKDLALFSLYLVTGLRSISVIECKIKDFDSINMTLKVKLKGGDEHLQKLPPITVKQIERYLASRTFKSSSSIEEEPLWLNTFNKPIGFNCILNKFYKFKSLAGITENVGGAHFFRHLFYSEAITDGFELKTIINATGVKGYSEINPYVNVRFKQIQEKMKTKHRKFIINNHENVQLERGKSNGY